MILSSITDLKLLLAERKKPKVMALAVAEDHHALDAAYKASIAGYVKPILIGNAIAIGKLADKYDYDLSTIETINEIDPSKAVERAVRLVNKGDADILMKGNVPTSTLLKGVLNKEWGLRTGSLLSHFAFFELPNYHKLLGLTDVAMNIAPNLDEKVQILNNSVAFMNNLGVRCPKIAPICAVETVNPKMQATLDAATLAQMNKGGQIKNCLIDGPLAFDNAISKDAAIQKGIVGDVAGDVDLLLFPTIEAGNAVYKALSAFGNARLAAVILGATAPIVLTSRADTEETKLNSILLAAAAK